VYEDLDAVSAAGVVTLCAPMWIIQLPEIARAAAVFEDYVLVELIEIPHGAMLDISPP
jgi:hypothetical protein